MRVCDVITGKIAAAPPGSVRPGDWPGNKRGVHTDFKFQWGEGGSKAKLIDRYKRLVNFSSRLCRERESLNSVVI